VQPNGPAFLPPRLPLSQVILTGNRRFLRQGILYSLVALGAVVAALHWVDSHRLTHAMSSGIPEPWHSYAVDRGTGPAGAVLLLAVAAAATTRARFAWGLATAILGVFITFFVWMSAALVHFLSSTQVNAAGSFYLFALGLMFLLSIGLLVVEPWAHLASRSAMERSYQQRVVSTHGPWV
jgi:hypothetical protein